MPSDPVALSFWLCKNILPNEEDRLNIFMSNSVTDRMQIIGKSMNVVSVENFNLKQKSRKPVNIFMRTSSLQTRFFICKHCKSKLANFNALFAMSKQGVQSSYCNPSK